MVQDSMAGKIIYSFKMANLLTLKRNELASLIVYEAGKTILEALGDVDEAIDFLDFYAREEGRIQKREKGEVLSRGVSVVISPWNFPLAIPCGMVSAPLVSGNTVILKSAEQTPLIAQKMVDLFMKPEFLKKLSFIALGRERLLAIPSLKAH